MCIEALHVMQLLVCGQGNRPPLRLQRGATFEITERAFVYKNSVKSVYKTHESYQNSFFIEI